MMTHTYAEAYLDTAMDVLGEAFDYAVNECGLDIDDFMRLFITTGIADAFEHGNPKFIAGHSGTELVMEIVSKAGLHMTFPPASGSFDCSPEYWSGWILAYYQWETGCSFRKLHDVVSMQDIRKLYSPMHEASEQKFVDTINAILQREKTSSRLQKQRKLLGYSQKELAEKTNVNLRTLQQYETGAKDLAKASFQTVVTLANALGCHAEDLIEPIG